jgi:hypothetical protein
MPTNSSLSDIARRIVKINKSTGLSKETLQQIMAASKAKRASPKASRIERNKSKPVTKKVLTRSLTKTITRPKPVTKQLGIKLEKLINNCLPKQREYAIRDRVQIISIKVNKAGTQLQSRSLTHDNQVRPPQNRIHKHWVSKVINNEGDEKKPFSQSCVQFNCDCENACFTWEYALHEKNAAKIMFCNGEFPYITNPSLYPGICKHGFVLLHYIRMKKL